MTTYRATWVCPHCLGRNPPADTQCGRCGVEIAPGGPHHE